MGYYTGDDALDLPRWRGLLIVPTNPARREMEELDMDLFDAADILENGFDCAKSKRGPGVYERCIREGRKVLRVVAVPAEVQYPDGSVEKIWKIIHVGKGGVWK